MIPFVDIHTHLPKVAQGVVSVQNFTQNDLYTEGGQNASVGLHPWFLTKENVEQDFKTLSKRAMQPNVVAIGECGLDRLRGESLAFQTQVFEQHIRLAEQVQKPVIIHCVRAFNEVVAVKRRMNPRVPLLIHGFHKNETILQDLLRHGFYISVGAAILRGGHNAHDAFKHIPIDRLFLETDDADVPIERIYAAYATLTGIGLMDLKEHIYQRFASLFLSHA
ncbi:MAG: TatD family hydrolase [Saprospiraceae bacterium]|nr:TatD family hydrolase [Saprospiraceae bacterium]